MARLASYTLWLCSQICQLVSYARINVKPGRGGGAVIGRAFDDTGLPRGRAVIVVKPGGGQLNLSLGTKWPCHCKETGTRPRHPLVAVRMSLPVP